MPKSGTRDGSSAGSRRTSLFALSSLTQIKSPPSEQSQNDPSKTLRKKRAPSVPNTFEYPAIDRSDSRGASASHASHKRRPSLSIRPSVHRPGSSMFGSLRSMRSTGDDEPPLPPSTTSSKAPSVAWEAPENAVSQPKTVLHHGEVQTSSSVFRKKKEYLVLTETHLVRCKSQAKAAEVFPGVPSPFGRSPTVRHTSMQSIGSAQDLQSLGSDSSGDKDGRIPLRQLVAVHQLDDGKPYFAMEVCSLDEDRNEASAMTLQFNNPDDRDGWLRSIRFAANNLRMQETGPVSAYNASYVARTVERAHDYDPACFSVYKIVQRQASKSGSRSSTDDLSKVASVVCFLAIGIHKVHIIPLAKNSSRTSSPSLVQNFHGSFGILSLTCFRLNPDDDTFEMTFRQPLAKSRTFHLASLSSPDIAIRFHHVENILRPECTHGMFRFFVPPFIEERVPPPVNPQDEEHSCFERTLTAYCVAYDANPSSIRYTIDYACEDAPRFILLQVGDPRRRQYNAPELLAVMRALRYNESFGSISFADVGLDVLNGLHDAYGKELVCQKTKLGTALRLSASELENACLLVQEVRALAATSKKLRRMDFSGCINIKSQDPLDETTPRSRDIGCGVVEALFPLCKHQTTNVDWIAMNGILLSDLDLDYLVGAAVDRACHFRALELSRCGLNDRSLGLILDALRAQDNTLEALDLSGNFARLSPAVFDGHISVFGFIRQLNLSHLARTSGPEPLLTADTLSTWRLETLRLSGTKVNEKTVEALKSYLQSPQSDTLHELSLDNAYLTGTEIAELMRAMTRQSGQPRELMLNISHNNISKDHDQLVNAIAEDHSPTHVTLQAMEYRDETVLRHLLNAIRVNRSTRYLDISRSSLPTDATEDTSIALERMFAENDSLEELDISGEDSRLEVSKFGFGLNRALSGLKHNQRLCVLRIQYQKLGLPGASTLADVLKENSSLREIHCEHNDIPLSAFTDMVNALHKNTTLIYLPDLYEGRMSALKQTERQVKQIRDDSTFSPTQSTSSSAKTGAFGMRRGFASVKRNVSRSASSYTPSFPSLPPTNRSGADSPSASSSPFSSPSKARRSSSTPMTGPLPQLSEQDVQAALRLVAESWDRQQYRLQQYLYRNSCILQGIPTAMEIKEEDFERPESVGSLGNVLERVKIDSTPTVEKEIDFGNHNLLDVEPIDGTTLFDGHEPLLDEEEMLGPILHHLPRDINRNSPSMQLSLRTNLSTQGEDMNYGHERFLAEHQLSTATPEELRSPVSPVDADGDGLEMGLGIREDPRTPTKREFFS